MPWKKLTSVSVSGKTAAIGMVVATVMIVGGAITYSALSKNGVGINSDALTTIREWIEDMNDSKNEPRGCCLPLCEEYGETECTQRAGSTWDTRSCDQVDECNVGCCEVDCLVKEGFPQESCEHVDGKWKPGACNLGCCRSESGSQQIPEHTCTQCLDGKWEEGPCGPGYSVTMDSTFSTTIGGEPFVQHLTVDLHTCEDTVFSIWRGKETYVSNGETESVQIIVNLIDGHTEVSVLSGSAGYEASVTEAKMNMSMSADIGFLSIGHELEGPVRQGAQECQKQL